MTEEQAVNIVVDFLENVDGGCIYCAAQAIDAVARQMRDLDWVHIIELAAEKNGYIASGILEECSFVKAV